MPEELIIVNAQLTGKVRSVMRNGREFLVGRAVILKEGVLNGSRGPIFYPRDLFPLYADWWDNVLVTIRHPTENGKPVKARQPKVVAQFGVGQTFDSVAEEDKLYTDVWLDVEDTRRVDVRVVNAMRNGQLIGLSTGVYTSETPAPANSTHNGVPYAYVATTLRPDHLALLPDEVGACSIAQGCGLLVNQDPSNLPTGDTMTKPELVQWLTANCDCWKQQGDADLLGNMSEAKLQQLKANAEKQAKPTATIVTSNTPPTTPPAPPAPASPPTSPTPSPAPPQTPPTPTPAAPAPQGATGNLTAEEWMRQAPPEIKSAVGNAINVVNREKAQVVQRITANTPADRKEQAVKFYMGKDLEELQIIEASLPVAQYGTQNTQQQDDLPSWLGQFVAPPTQNHDVATDPAYVLNI